MNLHLLIYDCQKSLLNFSLVCTPFSMQIFHFFPNSVKTENETMFRTDGEAQYLTGKNMKLLI